MTKALEQYLITALWSSIDDNDEPLDSCFSIQDIAEQTIKEQDNQLSQFLEQASIAIGDEFIKFDITDIAHDFWLTRNRHGAGFWDGDYPKYIGDKLTELSHKFGEVYAYIGKDGKIYFE